MEKNNHISKNDSPPLPGNKNMAWEVKVSIFTNPIIVKEIGMAIGIPFFILISFLLIISKGDILGTDTKYAFFLIFILFLFTFILIMALYGGKYHAGFTIDSKGILNYTQKKQLKKNRILNGLLIFLGFLTGKPGVAGTGLLADSRQSVFIKWSNIRKVKFYPKSYSIIVRGGYTEKIGVFCTMENYQEVKSLIISKTKLN